MITFNARHTRAIISYNRTSGDGMQAGGEQLGRCGWARFVDEHLARASSL